MNKIFIKKKEKKKPLKEKKIFFSFLLMALILIAISYYNPSDKVSAPDETVHSSKYTSPKISSPSKTESDTFNNSENNAEKILIDKIDNSLEKALDDKDKLSQNTPDKGEKQIISHITLPVKGEILKPFSDAELIYSETMGDFRTHSGIDISANIGDKVCSPANGRITEISKDEKLGYTIVIDHGNMISKISNLSSQIDVKTGDKVSSGSKIALVGDSAEYEILDPPHIHYELIKNGVSVNPVEYIE